MSSKHERGREVDIVGQPKVSIIMPMHNAEPYLRECLDSAVGQTLKDIEIICVNGGSTDGTLSILQEYAARDNRIRVISHGDVGLGVNMNTGIDAARGEFIGILESDDYIQPDMYETLYRTAKEKRVDFVKSDYEIFVDDGPVRKFEYAPVCPDKSDYGRIWDPQSSLKPFSFAMPNWTGIFRTAFLRRNDVRFNETPGASYQDNSFWFISFAAANRICFVNKAFYMLRRDNPNSSVNSKEKVYCMCEAYDYIRAWLERDPKKLRRFVYTYQYYKFGNYTYNLNRIAYKFKFEFLQRFSAEFRQARDQGELKEEAFLPHQWRDVNFIIDDVSGYFRTYYYNAEEELKLSRDSEEKNYQLNMAIQEIEAIHSSVSYRVGRTITWLPRFVRRGVRYVSCNGVRHTLRRIREKTIKKRRRQPNPQPTHLVREPLPPIQNGCPRVSVVLAVKNAAEFLEESMQSILRQTLHEIEIICVYDESSDETLEILQKAARDDSRVKIVKGNKTGPGGARNVGMKYIKGEYMTFLDGDDVFELSMLEEMYRTALREEAEVTVCQSESWSKNIDQGELIDCAIDLRLIPERDVFSCHDCPKTFFRAFVGWAWDKLIKTSYVVENELHFGDYFVCEDAVFSIPAMARAERIAVIRTVLVHHRTSDTSLEATPTHFLRHWHDAEKSFAYIRGRLEEWGLYDELRVGFLNWVVHYSLWLLARVPAEEQGRMRAELRQSIWPSLQVDQLKWDDYLYQDEMDAANVILGRSSPPQNWTAHLPEALSTEELREQYEVLNGHYEAMRNSLSFRIGRVITFLPRKLRGGVRCLKENGLRYTIRCFFHKIRVFGRSVD